MTDRDKTLRVAVRKFGPFESAIEKAWADFAAAENLDMTLDAQALDLHPLHEQTMANDGLKNGDWDVMLIVTDWFAEYNAANALLDLTPYLAQNPPPDYPNGWTDSLLRMQQMNGKVLGLPFHDGPECFIYRKDLFNDPAEQAAYREQFGVDLKPPETWDEFRQVARFFNRPAENRYGTVFAAYPDGHNTVYDFCLHLWTRGGELFNANGNMTLDTPQAAAALTFYREMLKDEGAMHPKARELDSVGSGNAFAAGEVAMMMNWFGFAAMVETIPDSTVKGNVGVTTIPSAPDADSASLSVYWLLSIAAGSPHPDLAYRFIRHCATPEMDKMRTFEGAIGCRKSTWYDDEINEMIPFYRQMEDLHQVARELPALPNWSDLAGVIDDMVLAAINTDRPTADILKEAQAKVS